MTRLCLCLCVEARPFWVVRHLSQLPLSFCSVHFTLCYPVLLGVSRYRLALLFSVDQPKQLQLEKENHCLPAFLPNLFLLYLALQTTYR